MTRPVWLLVGAGLVGAKQNAVADAGGFARLGLARRHDADFRRRRRAPVRPIRRERRSIRRRESRPVTSASVIGGNAPG